ncbi:hypothetical protein [Protaetiibacter larvae]|uniref:DUF5666 domain-containing protein n=1 Tax=Protaetiibacter larvae TaxID=2592654 RepID=A0A5C1Y8P2_9MICO|nr:hypothetical protein [Protaetiibacter larvae]QEO10334.1 hypothetical protein FLP23_10140 [Protaetiibacter larvae]
MSAQRVGAVVAVAVVSLLVLTGCSRPQFPRNEDGAFEGTVTSVREDGLDLRIGDATMRVDTWAVCGDDTARHISVGDELVVFADRETFDYDAWRILTPDGDPACPR